MQQILQLPFNITSFNAFFTETMNQTGNSINMNFTNFVLHSQINEGTFINNMSLYLNNYGTNFFNQSQYFFPILFFGAYNDTRYGLLQFNCSIQFQLYFFLTSPRRPRSHPLPLTHLLPEILLCNGRVRQEQYLIIFIDIHLLF